MLISLNVLVILMLNTIFDEWWWVMIDNDDDVAGEFQPILAEVGGRAVSDSSFLHRDNQPC